jgi:acid phosphatase
MTKTRAHLLAALVALAPAACGGNDKNSQPDAASAADATPPTPDAPPFDQTAALRSKVKTVVVIYAENWSFDSLFGTFPGANGIPGVNPTAQGSFIAQLDRDTAGTTLAKLPQTWGGVTAAGFTPAISQAMSDNLPNTPYSLEATYAGFDKTYITRDLYHRFFENQMQIDGGKNDKFAAWADSGGLVMGYVDGSKTSLWSIAQQYTLLDDFFMGTFGGSFLNHQYLICACAPEYPNADTATAKPTIAIVDQDSQGKPIPSLTIDSTKSPASAIDGPPSYMLSGAIAPKNYFGDGTFRAVNTMQPPYQPSGNAPAAADTDKLYADPAKANTLPPQTQTNVGDQLDAKSITWAWYSGAWTSTTELATTTHVFPPNTTPGSAPNFQFHHQPFNYYTKFDPVSGAAARTQHLKDYNDLVADIDAGTLPQVVFYKPEGDLNEHPGYAAVGPGDTALATLIGKLEASPQFANMVIVVTYDENGGWWDHVAPPKGDQLGPGTRIPALVISPYARKGTVDHTPYDTGSILRLLDRRFALDPLPGTTARDAALASHGEPAMGDLTNALDLTK